MTAATPPLPDRSQPLPSRESLPSVAPGILGALEQLVAIVAQLRSPQGGCPWDLEQTPQTLIPHVLEEAYEVADALRRDDRRAIVEELGDLLLQVVLQAQIAQDLGQFTLEEVAEAIAAKLVRRHPHVFGDVTVASVEEVRHNWEQIKAAEKATHPAPELSPAFPPTLSPENPASPTPPASPAPKAALLSPKLRRYGQTLPPLTAAAKISRKAAEVGFEWDKVEDVWDKVEEELQELREAVTQGDRTHQQSELGDILFALVQIARWYGLDATEALHGTNQRFLDRFALVEAHSDKPLTEMTPQEIDTLWIQAKRLLASPAP